MSSRFAIVNPHRCGGPEGMNGASVMADDLGELIAVLLGDMHRFLKGNPLDGLHAGESLGRFGHARLFKRKNYIAPRLAACALSDSR